MCGGGQKGQQPAQLGAGALSNLLFSGHSPERPLQAALGLLGNTALQCAPPLYRPPQHCELYSGSER